MSNRCRSLVLLIVGLVVAPLVGASPAAAAPPGNDARASASRITALPATIQGTTVEATVEADEPYSRCGLGLRNSVWYVFTPATSRSILVTLAAAGDMDATVEVFSRLRSQLTGVACAATNQLGNALADFDVVAGTEYLIRVAPLYNSVADAFTLKAFVPDEPASAPGDRMPAGGVSGAVDRFANPDDAWFVDLVRGRTYRLNLVTKGEGCAIVELFPAGTKNFNRSSPMRSRSCDAHTVFVAETSGRYPVRVRAPRAAWDTLTYRLRVGPALADDTAPGVPLRADTSTRGRLQGSELDALDLYRFGVARRSQVTIRLRTTSKFQLALMKAGGGVIDQASRRIETQLRRGRYYVAVRALDGADGAYSVRRHSRAITSSTMLVNGHRRASVGATSSVRLQLAVTPAVDGPALMLVERRDPIDGWLFEARFRPTVVNGSAVVNFDPSRLGRYRVTGSFLGTRLAGPSAGGTATWSVVEPLSLSARARR